MKNRTPMLYGIVLLYIFLSTLLVSCKKDETTLDEYRYRRSLQLRRSTTTTTDTTSTTTSGTTTGGTTTTTGGTTTTTGGTTTTTTTTGGTTTTTGGTTTRTNLLFDFTTEPSSALTLFAQNSLTNWNSIGACCSYSVQRSSDYSRAGSYSTRYELNSTDADVASSKRAEASRYSYDEPSGNIERWYGASYYLPTDYVTDAAPELLTQWQSTKGVSPPLALWTSNGKWLIVQNLDAGASQTTVSDYAKGGWTDFVFHVKWSTGSDGLIEVWKDGVKVFTKSGINTYTGITAGNYMKVGIYKWPWKKTDTYNSTTTRRIIYADEIRIGNALATYNDVKPGS